MTYYPQPENVSTPVDMFAYANTVTTDLFGIFILTGLWLIIFMAQKNYPTPKAFASASFTTAIASYFMFIMELIPVQAVLTTSVMVIGSIFFLRAGSKRKR